VKRIKHWLFCGVLRRHRWKFRLINAEGHKVFECARCGRLYFCR
jgi:hypothetical protein